MREKSIKLHNVEDFAKISIDFYIFERLLLYLTFTVIACIIKDTENSLEAICNDKCKIIKNYRFYPYTGLLG